MKRKIIIGTELGGNLGHFFNMFQIGSHLADLGYDVLIVPGRHFNEPFAAVHSARLSFSDLLIPNLPSNRTQIFGVANMADNLNTLGYFADGTLATRIRFWSSLISQERPSCVIADYAPSLLTASLGRVPSVSVGTGFTSPPTRLNDFPSWRPDQDDRPSDQLHHFLEVANREIRNADCHVINHLPQLFSADRIFVSSWSEFDPYRDHRSDEFFTLPSIAEKGCTDTQFDNRELFVYTYSSVPFSSSFWDALALCGFSCRIYMRDATDAHIARFHKLGLLYEPRPQSFEQLSRFSVGVISHGGHGLASSALQAGLPQLILAIDEEKALNGQAVDTVGAGLWSPFGGLSPLKLVYLIRQLSDSRYKMNAASVAVDLAQRRLLSAPESVAKYVSSL